MTTVLFLSFVGFFVTGSLLLSSIALCSRAGLAAGIRAILIVYNLVAVGLVIFTLSRTEPASTLPVFEPESPRVQTWKT